jgi:hypothetical protein
MIVPVLDEFVVVAGVSPALSEMVQDAFAATPVVDQENWTVSPG